MKVTKVSNHWLLEAENDGYLTHTEYKPIEERLFIKTIRVTEESINAFREATTEEIQAYNEYIKSLESNENN